LSYQTKTRFSATCSVHLEREGFIYEEISNATNFIDAEAEFVKKGWTGEDPYAVCPSCSKKYFSVGDLQIARN
jgi:hypothetical protein